MYLLHKYSIVMGFSSTIPEIGPKIVMIFHHYLSPFLEILQSFQKFKKSLL